MRIVVFIKEIPLSNNIKIDPKTNNMIRSGEQGRINPYDLHAIEAALDLKERYGGSISLVSMGPDSFKMSLREGLAMGCDDAYLISSRAFAGSDTLATAYTLAQIVRKIGGADVLLFGLKAIDADTGQVGPLVAEELDLPQVTMVSAINNIDKEHQLIDITRKTEKHTEVIRTQYPIVLTVDESMNTPRYVIPRLVKHIMNAEITVYNEVDLDCDVNRIGMAGSRTIVTNTYVPETVARQVTLLSGTPKDAASELIQILKEKHLL